MNLDPFTPENSCLGNFVIVIPVKNDEITLGSVILKAKAICDKIIVINDNSTDRSVELCKEAGVEIISLYTETGKGNAIINGLKCACNLESDVVMLIDGDSHYRVREIPLLYEHIISNEADIVIGSRFLGNELNLPIKQRIKQKLLKISEDKENSFNITDPFSGFMAFKKEIIENLDFSYTNENFYPDFINHFISNNINITEFPIIERDSFNLKPFWDYSSKVAVALPAYNEENSIASLIETARPFVDIVLVVDDGSSDATVAISKKMGALVISHQKNQGYGGALQTIFSTARALNIEALVIMDSDGQHNPHDIPSILEPLLDGADLVIGSRFIDSKAQYIPRYRKFGMKILDRATSFAGAKKVTDTQSGFRGYGKKAIDKISISGNGMSAGSEILISAGDNGLKIVEVPIKVRYDIDGTSSQNPLYHGISVISNLISLISYRKPLVTFGLPGLIMVIVGFLYGGWVFHRLVYEGIFHYYLLMVVAFTMVVGILLMTTALILNSLIKIVKMEK